MCIVDQSSELTYAIYFQYYIEQEIKNKERGDVLESFGLKNVFFKI